MTEQEIKQREQAFLDHSKGWEASLLKNAREDFEAGWAARGRVKKDLIAGVVISEERAEFCTCGYPHTSAGNSTGWKMVCSKCKLPKQN